MATFAFSSNKADGCNPATVLNCTTPDASENNTKCTVCDNNHALSEDRFFCYPDTAVGLEKYLNCKTAESSDFYRNFNGETMTDITTLHCLECDPTFGMYTSASKHVCSETAFANCNSGLVLSALTTDVVLN